MAEWFDELDARVDAIADELRATRRHLHAHPEPSGAEYETAALLADRLRSAGIPVRSIPSGRGVIAGPGSQGPAVAFRGDIDALRMQDLKDAPYRSTRAGLMHACGHDAHATMALGAALALWACRDRFPWPVPWRALLQPAEETGRGAAEMVEAGAVEGATAVIALHVDPDTPVGSMGYRTGPLTAFCADLAVTVTGAGGHGARPHQTTDPVAAAVQFVAGAYQVVPRSTDAREAVVVTFGVIRGGSSPNVIPDKVELLGTVRTLSRATAEAVGRRLSAIGRGVAEATGAAVEVRLTDGVDAVHNDPAVTALCVEAAAGLLGPAHVVPIPLPSMGGEDFSGYLAHAPGCMLRLGVGSEALPRHPLHSPYFDIDERALAVGAKYLARAVVLLAGRGPGSTGAGS